MKHNSCNKVVSFPSVYGGNPRGKVLRGFEMRNRDTTITSGAFDPGYPPLSHIVTITLSRAHIFDVSPSCIAFHFPPCQILITFYSLFHIKSVMPATTRQEKRNRKHERSYKILQDARNTARKQRAYDSAQTREDLKRLFLARFGQSPHNWQLNTTEAMLLGLDAVVIAGTGAGKTMLFMPLLLDVSCKS